MTSAAVLAELGYEYVRGPSGETSDLVLRQCGSDNGFEWRGQENYDHIGAAVVGFAQDQLTSICGLKATSIGPGGNSTVWTTARLDEHKGPVLVLVCGMAPGGAAAVWGRSLCINSSTREGAMFDYIFRAKQRGWAVVVANPNVNTQQDGEDLPGSECGHTHLRTVWRELLGDRLTCGSPLLIVAHSYGAPATVHLLKTEAKARERVSGLVLTDGWCYEGCTLLRESVHPTATDGGSGGGDATSARDTWLAKLASLAPAAGEEASEELRAILAAVGRNYVASPLPSGALVAAERDGMPALSAGHESHPSTTAAAAEVAFAFLDRAARGEAAAANAELHDEDEHTKKRGRE